MSDDTLTIEEVREAIGRLGEADLLRLTRACRKVAQGLRRDGEEFLSEAVTKALTGERVCPRDVPVATFLYMAACSLVSSERETGKRQVKAATAAGEATDAGYGEVAAPGRNAEERLIAREDFESRLQALDQLFENDEEAQLVIMCEREDMRGEQICRELSMTPKDLATTQRRIRRTIDRAYPQGWLS